MWGAAHEFERAAERAATERARKVVLKAIGYDEEPVERPPAPRLDDQLRYFFFGTVAPLFIWVIKACFFIFTLLILAAGSYGLIWSLIMRGLEVRSRPIFFDYSPGDSMMPMGMVNLQSTKSAPWDHTRRKESDNPSIDGGLCMNNEEMDILSNNREHNERKENDATNSDANAILLSGQRYFFEVALTLPESEINKQLGVFMIKVDLRSSDRSLLASSKQHSMLPFESTIVSLFRKIMLILPLASGLLSETRTINLLCFDNYVDVDDKKSMSLVEVSLGVPNPAVFPATMQTLQIHSAELRYGKEMNATQTLFRKWRYFFAFVGTTVLFMGYSLIALSILHYRAQRIRWNTQPYADFFDSDDESIHNADAASNDRWMGVDIEILEDDEDDEDAWEPIDSREKNEPSEETTHRTAKPAHNNLVSDDESFFSSRQDAQGKKRPNMAFPLGNLAESSFVKDHEPLLAASKPKGKEEHKKGSSDSKGGSGSHLKTSKMSAQEKEEKCLADMVMEGGSSSLQP